MGRDQNLYIILESVVERNGV